MSNSFKRAVQGVLLVCVVGGSGLVMAGPALAENDGWNYIVVQDSNCGWRGGHVTYVQGAVWGTDNYIQTWSGGDGGDNIVWAATQRSLSNTFNGRAFCSNGAGSKWITLYRTFVPRPNQAVRL